MCDICKDVGYYRLDVPYSDPYFGKMIRCQCKAREDAERLQRAIGTSMAEVKWAGIIIKDRPGTEEMVHAARHFVQSKTGWLTIYGTNGIGKTMTLKAITWACIKAGVIAIYITAHDLIEYLKAGIGDDDNSVDDRLRSISDIPVLCLDELAAVRWTDWVAEQIESLLDIRYQLRRATVLAMDKPPEDYLSHRLCSRLKEGRIIHNMDSDMRPLLHGN